eukprot:602557-Pyramimonas_sp.AAC.1
MELRVGLDTGVRWRLHKTTGESNSPAASLLLITRPDVSVSVSRPTLRCGRGGQWGRARWAGWCQLAARATWRTRSPTWWRRPR